MTVNKGLVLAAVLAVLAPRARAEDVVSYKYEDYRESAGRISVETHGVYLEKDFGTQMRLKAEGVIDAIAGASPNGQPAPAGNGQVPLSRLTDRRKAWSADFSRQFERVVVEAGYANSRESDWVSHAVSLNTVTDFNQRNTSVLAGVARISDSIKVFHQRAPARKHTVDVIAGVTQLLDPNASFTANLTYGRSKGYLNDQYKLVQKDLEIIPGVFLPLTFAENRPDFRARTTLFLGYNRALPGVRGAIELNGRYHADSFKVQSRTVELTWFQRVLGDKLILQPGGRYYNQGAADFYFYRLDGTPIVPAFGPPRPDGPFYSSDYRLSKLHSYTYGLKVVWTPVPSLRLDAALESYRMAGRDGVTPRSAYPKATIATFGGRFSW